MVFPSRDWKKKCLISNYPSKKHISDSGENLDRMMESNWHEIQGKSSTVILIASGELGLSVPDWYVGF